MSQATNSATPATPAGATPPAGNTAPSTAPSGGDVTLLGAGMATAGNTNPTPAPATGETGRNGLQGGENGATGANVNATMNTSSQGDSGLFPLPDNASDDQRAEFDRKMRALNGVPNNAADYGDFGLGETLQINTEAEDYRYYTELFKEIGLSKAQAGKLIEKHLEYMQGQAEHYKRTNDAQIQEYRNKVKNDFVRQCGGEQGFIEFSQTAARGFQAAAQGAGLNEKDVRGIMNVMGDDPRFLRIFNSIGKLYREDVLVTGAAPRAQEKSFEDMFSGMFNHQQ